MEEKYEVKNEEIINLLKEEGRAFKMRMPEGWGFTLFMFNYGKESKKGDGMFYLSSAQRQDMIKSLEEFILSQKMLSNGE